MTEWIRFNYQIDETSEQRFALLYCIKCENNIGIKIVIISNKLDLIWLDKWILLIWNHDWI